jgi:antitoxin component of MazEF toxin-antitoxin module
MNIINTSLTTAGNSVAVRLPKELLKMSGLTNKVTLEAKQGKIIISKATSSREGWRKQIEAEIATHGLPNVTDEYGDMREESENSLSDGLK